MTTHDMPDTAQPLRGIDDLAAAGLISGSDLAGLEAVAARYAVSITPDMAGLIDPTDPDDPIARQFVPDTREAIAHPADLTDPIGDVRFSPVDGIVHRYPDRVLLKLVHSCPVYCRFCFRREVVGPRGPSFLSAAALDRALAYVAADPAIWEVIFTGGDPFVLSPRRMHGIVGRLAAIPHVEVLRWHTRVPIVDPGQVTPALVSALKAEGKASWVALHANHPREFTPAALKAIGRLVDAGIPLLGQSVLLRGVNDDPETLGALMRAFVKARVKPYYLHHGDLAPGTAHLRTRLDEGRALIAAIHGRSSGLCQPTYVLDIPGGHGKVPVGPCHVLPGEGSSEATILDDRGERHAYPPRGTGDTGAVAS